jgi:RNA polymerase sigma-70 factor (ECF subfamily)
MEVLAPDVVVISDGGGVVPATRKRITGADRVAWFLSRLGTLPGFTATLVSLNGMPGARMSAPGPAGVTAVSLVIEEDRITTIYAIRNPHKLGWLDKVADLRR